MKNLIIMLAMLAFVFTGCGGSSGLPDPPPIIDPPPITEPGFDPDAEIPGDHYWITKSDAAGNITEWTCDNHCPDRGHGFHPATEKNDH